MINLPRTEIEDAAQTKRRDNDEAVVNSAQTLNTLVASINRQLSKLVHVIGEKQKATEREADMLVKEEEEEKEIIELKIKSTWLEGISHIEDHIHFNKCLQSFTSSSSQFTQNWFDIKYPQSALCGTSEKSSGSAGGDTQQRDEASWSRFQCVL